MAASPVTPSKLMERRRAEDDTTDFPTGAGGNEERTLTLDDLSWPPTAEELASYKDVALSDLPKKYKRPIQQRVFVNREVRLDRIEAYGWDMDHTLAVYESPAYDALTYELVVERLLSMGYPASIKELKYNHSFPIRGLMCDTKLGNMLKVDSFGAILVAVHGHTRLSKAQLLEAYPAMFVHSDDIGGSQRFYVFDTLYAAAETCLYADLVEMLEDDTVTDEVFVEHKTDLLGGDLDISYQSLFIDVRSAVDHIHRSGALKGATVANLPKYVKPQPELSTLLRRMRSTAKVFLLTNSHFEYTNSVMTYLLEDSYDEEYPNWRSYFDIVIVGAKKPLFFGAGTTLREVDVDTGNLKLGKINTHNPDAVYQGGSLKLFNRLLDVNSAQVLYIGDHIFGDIIKSKDRGWKTLLVVKELDEEILSWNAQADGYRRLQNLEFMLAEIYRGLDSTTTDPPNTRAIRANIKAAVEELNTANNVTFGSVFRHGSKQTFFAMQVQRYADLYASCFTNLVNYPLFYHFIAPDDPLPHERDSLAFGGGSAAPIDISDDEDDN